MFLHFFGLLRTAKTPVSLKEFLDFLNALKADLVTYDLDGFYHLARLTLIKDERYIDRFDQAFKAAFEGMENISLEDLLSSPSIPDEWIKKLAEKTLSDEEKSEIDALGGFEKLMDTLKKRLAEQEKRHQGGSKWIGTAGTSPFGAYGYNPEGIRIGQAESRHQRAVKVWDKREFKDFDTSKELGTRNIKMALKGLRKWAHDGAMDEFDLKGTIDASAHVGYIDVKTKPERRNAVKLILFLDVGGSMDPYISQIETLFSAASSEFKRLEYYYFHNCLYEGVWKDNRRRWNETQPTLEVLNRYGPDYKCIFAGDASMSPYELLYQGGANEHWNEETGKEWLKRVTNQWQDHVWINPTPENQWKYTQSIGIIREIFDNNMFPMTVEGVAHAVKSLSSR